MALNSYITLGNNDGVTNLKRFYVLQGSYQPTRTKTQTRRRSITGKADTQEGFIVTSWQMTLHCKDTVASANDGTLYDLRSFFMKNAASGANSGRLTFWEFDDTQVHTVELIGTLAEENITPVLQGTETVFYVPIVLEQVN